MDSRKKLRTIIIITTIGIGVFFFFSYLIRRYLGLEYPYGDFLFYRYDLFMDFFNVNYMASDLNPYLEGNSSYPPFILLIAKVFSNFGAYRQIAAHLVRTSTIGMLTYLSFFAVFTFLLYIVIVKVLRKIDGLSKVEVYLYSGLLLINAPFIFMADRGNYLIIALLFYCMYFLLYDKRRNMASAMLGVSASIKIYPALAMVFYLFEKKYKEFIISLSTFLGLSFISICFFRGGLWNNILTFIKNVFGFGKGYEDQYMNVYFSTGLNSLLKAPFVILNNGIIPRGFNITLIFLILCIIILSISLIFVYKEKIIWKRALIITILIILLSPISSYYNLTLLLAPVLLFILDKNEGKNDKIYACLMGVLLIPKAYIYFVGIPECISIEVFLNPLLLLGILGYYFYENKDYVSDFKIYIFFTKLFKNVAGLFKKLKEKIVFKRWDYETFLSLGFLLIIYLIFNLLLFNKYFPPTEGWFQDYNNYINDGQVPYRDFYMFIPPGFPYLMALIGKLTNNVFIAFRLYGIAERLVLITLVYFIIRRLYSNRITFISVLTAGIIYISNIQDVFYGYYQSGLLCGVIIIYFAIKLYENIDVKPLRYSILMGISIGITFLFKHTTGAILSSTISLGIILITWKKDWRQNLKTGIKYIFIAFISSMLMIGSTALIFGYIGALQPFIEQVFLGASSKGSLFTVFFSFIPRMINNDSLLLLSIVIGIFLLSMLRNKRKSNIDIVYKILILIGLLALAGIFFKIFFMPLFDIRIINAMGTKAILYFGVILLLLIYIHCNVKLSSKGSGILYYGCLALFLISILLYISKHCIEYADFSLLRANRQNLIYALFFAEFIYMLYLLYDILIHKNSKNKVKLIIVIAAWTIMYIHGMSNIVEDHGTLLAFSLFIGEFLNHNTSANKIKNVTIYVFCLLMFIGTFIQRNNLTYHWWGVNLSPTTYQALYTFDDPKLIGMYSDHDITSDLNDIYHIVMNNKVDGDTMYTFPHINYFSGSYGLKSPTFAKVHYFDVCADYIAISDAKILKENPPTFIIWQELPEDVWALHEEVFRSGERSGQRDIQDAKNYLINSNKYILLGSYDLSGADPIYVWGLKDGRTWVDETGKPYLHTK